MNQINVKPLIYLITCALFLQLIGHYFAGKYLVYNDFMGLWTVTRIILPLLVVLLLSIPLNIYSIKIPIFDKHTFRVVLLCFVGLVLLTLYLANFADVYLSHYRKGATLEYLRHTQRFERFMVFTVSTVIAWEIFHRGFLLGSIRYSLNKHMGIEPKSSAVIAMLFVSCFESLFHIKKPMFESIPFILASLVLSWLTIKTRSLWPALIIHFVIEVIFGYSAYVGW